ncbi:MAG: triose-phosphate isomerase [bacterium]|nr:triose-phosphate isomerase [bacterium]
MRRPIIAANWKMYKTAGQAQAFAEQLLPLLDSPLPVDAVIAAPFTALDRLGRALGGSEVALAAQNLNAEPEGAFTGEISVRMLHELACRYAIVGHSERRAIYGETSAEVSRKAGAAQRAGLRPIVCVGESLEDREGGLTLDVVGSSLQESLADVEAPDGDALVVAYEPVWAIGTGRNATPEVAQEVHAFIREFLGKRFGAVAESIRIQYGGSVKPANIAQLMAQPDIDGALVGGASLEPDSFAALIRGAAGN